VFTISPSQIAATFSPMTSGPLFTRPQSTGLSGLEQCWSFVTSATKAIVPGFKGGYLLTHTVYWVTSQYWSCFHYFCHQFV